MKKIGVAAALAAVVVALPARAQEAVPAACSGVPVALAGRCSAAVQTAHSMQPQLGILSAGGLPGLSAATRGIRLGPLARVDAAAHAGFVRLHMPRITDETNPPPPAVPGPLNEEQTVTAVALRADAALGVSPGLGAGRVGSLDLLGSISYLPFDLISREVFHKGSAQVALGAGVRLGVLAESAGLPGVSVSLMYRELDVVQIGTACEGDQTPDPFSTATPPSTLCREEGDVAQATVSTANWSTRAAVSKRVGALGLAVGAGYDRFSGDFDVEVLGPGGTPIAPTRVYHSPGGKLESDRWSGFLNASFALPFGALSGEVGWMQGGERVPGFQEESDFDPEKGTVFLSVGARLSM